MCGQYAHPRLDAYQLFFQGTTDEEMIRAYPALTVDHLNLVREYYKTHRAEIDRDIREQEMPIRVERLS